MSTRRTSSLYFLLAFATLLVAIHLTYLRLPFHWDELGQFVPAALDLYRDGAWIPHSTVPNVHPPGLMAILAGVWHWTGYSIPVTRAVMLGIASLGTLFAFLLAIRLARGSAGAPAFAAILFLIASPLFYTQSMMVLLDMPAMALTALVLLLFLDGRFAWSAAASVALVLVKETGVTTPLILAAFLWLKDARRKEALYFAAPLVALGCWLLFLHHATGHWLGNEDFATQNFQDSLRPGHIAAALIRNLWILFGSDGKFLGTLALVLGWRLLRGREWQAAAWVGLGQFALVTLLGGAMLERYLLPVFPIVFAAMAVAASNYPRYRRWGSQFAMVALLIAGWFWNPPYPGQMENLSMVNFVRLQQDAASFLEAFAPTQRIASIWPFTGAISRPEFGYVEAPLSVVPLQGLDLASLADADRASYDVLVVYSHSEPLGIFDRPFIRRFWQRFLSYPVEATEEQIRNGLGLELKMYREREGHWIAIYARP